MAVWTTPVSVVTGELMTAVAWEDQVKENLQYLYDNLGGPGGDRQYVELANDFTRNNTNDLTLPDSDVGIDLTFLDGETWTYTYNVFWRSWPAAGLKLDIAVDVTIAGFRGGMGHVQGQSMQVNGILFENAVFGIYHSQINGVAICNSGDVTMKLVMAQAIPDASDTVILESSHGIAERWVAP